MKTVVQKNKEIFNKIWVGGLRIEKWKLQVDSLIRTE